MLTELLLTVSLASGWAEAFNLDTQHPVILRGNGGADYFGYSVALHRNRDGAVALVGAPRANSSVLGGQVQSPGALYRCNPLRTSTCMEVVLDRKGNTGNGLSGNGAYQDKKDGMWLGVSLDIQRNNPRNDIVTCGHLWKNQLYRTHYLVNGVCYVINGDLDPSRVAKLVPMVNKTKQAIMTVNPGIYYYAFGQVGTSASFSEDGKYLHLGAPGFSDWTGTVVSYNVDTFQYNQQLRQSSIPDPPIDQTLTPESYIGYSVTSGKFYGQDENFVAAGAPRDGGFFGRVYIYKTAQLKKNMVVYQRKEGKQLGEYFGSVLLAMNLNADAYTDLLVGAPFYTATDSGVDEGKVYVYISNGMGLQEFAELYGRSKPNARFGSAIANVGDLNKDGYDDVAIGAPYEDTKGAIYIYHGSLDGLNVQYVQRISAIDISSSLSGFGIQISRGLDIDSNQYNDVLVGAYSSSSAVLFRTKPVIQLFPKLSFLPPQINMNVTNCTYQGKSVPCIDVTACLTYEGKNTPQSLEFENEIFVEHPDQSNLIIPRGFFLQNSNTVTAIRQTTKLQIMTANCIINTLYIRPDIKDVVTPVQILYSFRLKNPTDIAEFNSTFPMIDPTSPKNITLPISFKTGCGHDDVCHSDLKLKASVVGKLENEPVIIGKSPSLTITIHVSNKGDPAYLSELDIFLPPELPSINQDICSTVNDQQRKQTNATFICELANPLLHGQEVTITLKLDLTKIPTKRHLLIGLLVRTVSTDTTPADNSMDIPLDFIATADISISGTPAHEQIPFDEKSEDQKPVSIRHTYFVMNHGPSPVQVIDFKLYIPTVFRGPDNPVNFLTFTSLESDTGQSFTIPAQCNDTFLEIKPNPTTGSNTADHDLDVDFIPRANSSRNTFDLDYGIEDSVIGTNPSMRSKRSSAPRIFGRRKDVVIDCETAECVVIECSASPFIDSRKFAKIVVSATVDFHSIISFLDPWYRIEFVTSGAASIRDDGSGVEPKHYHPDRTTVKTIIVNSAIPASEEIAKWIIFASIAVGILLLLIILFLLIKFGFFRREQKEKVEDLKRKSGMVYFDSGDGETTESEVLN